MLQAPAVSDLNGELVEHADSRTKARLVVSSFFNFIRCSV